MATSPWGVCLCFVQHVFCYGGHIAQRKHLAQNRTHFNSSTCFGFVGVFGVLLTD